jgi:hypothetical protein
VLKKHNEFKLLPEKRQTIRHQNAPLKQKVVIVPAKISKHRNGVNSAIRYGRCKEKPIEPDPSQQDHMYCDTLGYEQL